MKPHPHHLSLAAIGLLLFTLGASAQLRLDDPLDYPDGELFVASDGLWTIRSGTNPYAEIQNKAIVVDHTQGRVFNGVYQRRWEAPSSTNQVYVSFKLQVTSPPEDMLGFTFAGVADIDFPDLYRARVFMKKGRAPGTYRLGLSTSSALPENALYFPADLQLNEEYLVSTLWDNVNLVARLYIDTNDAEAHKVQILGGTARGPGFRRFGISMNSERPLGRYEIRNVKVGEDWVSVQQAFTPKPDFEVDPPGLLLDERFFYANGELNAVSGNAWRVFPSAGTPYAEVVDQALVVDHRAGRTFDGEYHRLYAPPPDTENGYPILFASFRLQVDEAPAEELGFNFASIADRVTPESQRARVFMKKGAAPGTFRLGLSASSSLVSEGETQNAFFIGRDLAVGADHLVLLSWDNVNRVARLYLDTDKVNAPVVEVQGETPRGNLSRFALRTDSARDLGRYTIRDLLVAENWETVLQPFDDGDADPGYYDDAVLGRHYYAGGGWVLWADESGDPHRGVLYVPLRGMDGYGWVHHAGRGWLHLTAGSIADGLFAYARDHGWIYVWSDFGGEWFHVFATGAALRWVP